jgi:hypothetical protein
MVKKYSIVENLFYSFIFVGIVIGGLCFLVWDIEWVYVRLWIFLSCLMGIVADFLEVKKQ